MADEPELGQTKAAEQAAAKEPQAEATKNPSMQRFKQFAKDAATGYFKGAFQQAFEESGLKPISDIFGPASFSQTLRGTSDIYTDLTRARPKDDLQRVPAPERIPDLKLSFTRINTGLGAGVDSILQRSQDEVVKALTQTYDVLKDRVYSTQKSITILDRNVRTVDVRTKKFQLEISSTVDTLKSRLEKMSRTQDQIGQKFQKIDMPERRDVTKADTSGYGEFLENYFKTRGAEWAVKTLWPMLWKGVPALGALALVYSRGIPPFGKVDYFTPEGLYKERDKAKEWWYPKWMFPEYWQDKPPQGGLGPRMQGGPGQPPDTKKKSVVGELFGIGSAQAAERNGGYTVASQTARPTSSGAEVSVQNSILLKSSRDVDIKGSRITIEAGDIIFKGRITGLPTGGGGAGPGRETGQQGYAGVAETGFGVGQAPGFAPQAGQSFGVRVSPGAMQWTPGMGAAAMSSGLYANWGGPSAAARMTATSSAAVGGRMGFPPAMGRPPGGLTRGGAGRLARVGGPSAAAVMGGTPSAAYRSAGMAAYGISPRGGGPASAQRVTGVGGMALQTQAQPAGTAEIPAAGQFPQTRAGLLAERADVISQESTMFGPGARGIPEPPGLWGMMGNVAGALSGGAAAMGARIGEWLGGGGMGGGPAGPYAGGGGHGGGGPVGTGGGASGAGGPGTRGDPNKIIADVASGKISPNAGEVQVALSQLGLSEYKDKTALTEFMSGRDPRGRSNAWCAAFVNASLEKAGIAGTGSAAAASFYKWGNPVSRPEDIKAGDVLVQAHHVVIATGPAIQRNGRWVVPYVGGNESDSVKVGYKSLSAFQARTAREDYYTKLPPGTQVADVQSGKAVPASDLKPGGGTFGGGGATGTIVIGGGPNQVARVISAGKGFTQVEYADGRVEMRRGDFAWRNNNPGNIEFGPFAKRFGAIPGGGRFAMFPSIEAGNEARKAWWFEKHGGKTIADATAIYAPPNENDTTSYAARLAKAVGVSPDTPLSSLTADQQEKFLHAQLGIEGNKPGRVDVVKEGTGVPITTPTAAAPTTGPVAEPPDAPRGRGGADATVRIGAAPLPLSGGAAERGEEVSLGKMNPELRAALAASKADIDKAVDEGRLPASAKQFSVGSGFRPPDDPSIQKQYAEWLKGPRDRPMADPSKSRHGKGEAADLAGLPKDEASVAVLSEIFTKHGVHFPVGKEGLADTGMAHAQLIPGGPREPTTQVAQTPSATAETTPAAPKPKPSIGEQIRTALIPEAGAAERPSETPSITPQLDAEKAAKIGSGADLKVPELPPEPTHPGVSGKPVAGASPAEKRRAAGAYPGAKPDATPAPTTPQAVKVTGTTGAGAGASGTPPPKVQVTGTTGAGAGASGTKPKREPSNPQAGADQHKGKEAATQPKENKSARSENRAQSAGDGGSAGGGGGTSADHCHFCDP